MRAILTVTLVLFLALAAEASQGEVVLSTFEEIASDFRTVPCRNRDRLEAVRELFAQYGAPARVISIESFRDVENLMVSHEGTSSGTIVIGAHHDVAELGCGAVDNWTGVVALAHLYRTIRNLDVSKRVLFVAFGGEERGLLGSLGMVDSIPDESLANYCAMINLDSFGLAPPHTLEGSSSSSLIRLAEEVAEKMAVPFSSVTIRKADSDSSSFLERDIPAITLSGLSNDWRSVLHTVRDQPDKVNPASVFLGYRLALTLWFEIEQAPCGTYE